jgi:hypothetical protein
MTMTPEPAPAKALTSPSLFDIISWVETKHNSSAVRFEPATYEKLSVARTDSQKAIIANIMRANACSWGTALMIYSTSFGQVQLMGFNLYGPVAKYDSNIIEFCCDETVQRITFALTVASMKLDDITVAQLAASIVARHRFAITYNGSPEYADNIVAALKSYGIPVTQ